MQQPVFLFGTRRAVSAPVQESATLHYDFATEEGEGSQTGTREEAILPLDSEIHTCVQWSRLHCPLSALEPPAASSELFMFGAQVKAFQRASART